MISFIDLSPQNSWLKKEIQHAIEKVVQSSSFIQGKEVRGFEEEFAQYVGSRYCVSVNSGTDALILGIRALSIPEGSEVIVPANTFVATALAVSENRLKPVFVDADEADYGVNLNDLQRKITSRTRAVVVVHLYGQPDKLLEVEEIIKKSGKKIHLLEDACQAHGARYGKKKVGTFGIFGAFSFYPTKNLGSLGDGGAIVTSDTTIERKVRLLKEYGQKKKFLSVTGGVNSRLDEIQAAILRVKLRHLDTWNRERRKIARLYTRLLNEQVFQVTPPHTFSDREHVFHVYVVKAQDRNKLQQYLHKHNIFTAIHYPTPLHLQPVYSYLGYKKGDLPHAEKLSRQIVSLPFFIGIGEKEVLTVVEKIEQFYSAC